MPVTIKSIGGNKFRSSTPNGVHGKSMTHANAMMQKKIIDAADAGHQFTGKKKHGFGVGKKR